MLFVGEIFDFFFLRFAGIACTFFAVLGAGALCGSPGTMDVIVQTRRARLERVLPIGLGHVIAFDLGMYALPRLRVRSHHVSTS